MHWAKKIYLPQEVINIIKNRTERKRPVLGEISNRIRSARLFDGVKY